MSTTPVVLSKESANDETAAIVAVYVATGINVAEDELIFDIESSKATQEIRAPAAGILSHELVVGQEVGFGVPIARILPADVNPLSTRLLPLASDAPTTSSEDSDMPGGTAPRASADDRPVPNAAAPVVQHAVLAASTIDSRAPRFSRAAAAMIAKHGGPQDLFMSDFVTTQDVVARRALAAVVPSHSTVPEERSGRRVDRRKRAEIEALKRGAGGTLLSVLGATLGTISVTRAAGDFLQGRIVDLVIYEAARLMRKYRKLNAAFDDGQIFIHDAVHAGLAIDGGGRLAVYGIEHADKIGFHELSNTISDAVARYVDNTLTGKELSRATFTVTDLSDGSLDFVLPLLPNGQSCILGITRDAQEVFRLFAGFDHRVTEGREVASFLNELCARVVSFSAASAMSSSAFRCVYCDRPVAEVVERCRDKGLLRIVDRSGRDVLCCASCWNGW